VRPPDVVIVGAQKAATTGLLRTLEQHPRVCTPRAQEATVLHFGGGRWDDWVREREPDLERADTDQVLLVKLASAMYFPDTLESIKRLNPAVRLVAVLRHPVDRMLSQYLYAVQHGLETRPVVEALEQDWVERSGEYRLRRYSEGSRYADSVDRIHVHFDRAQVLYVDFDIVHTSSCLASVQEFLAIEPLVAEAVRANESRTPRSAILAKMTSSRALKTVGRRAVPARWRGPVRESFRKWNAASAPPTKPLIPPKLREELLNRHGLDVAAAEDVLSKSLPHWRC
jgi:hypothetical protein